MSIKIDRTAHIAKESIITGDVTIGEDSTVLYYTVIRGDNDPVVVGKESNLQEHCCLHTDPGYPLVIGDKVTVGHGCILHCCKIGNETIIGMGTIIMNGAVIGDHCLIGAGSLITEHTEIPSGMLALGRPAKAVRPLSEDNRAMLLENAEEYVKTGMRLFGNYGDDLGK